MTLSVLKSVTTPLLSILHFYSRCTDFGDIDAEYPKLVRSTSRSLSPRSCLCLLNSRWVNIAEVRAGYPRNQIPGQKSGSRTCSRFSAETLEGGYRRGPTVCSPELFTSFHGARPFNSYGRNDNIRRGGFERRPRGEREIARASTGVHCYGSATSLKRTIFQGALQFVGSRTEDECHGASRPDSFSFGKFFGIQADRPAETALLPFWVAVFHRGNASSLTFPCYFNCPATLPVIEVSARPGEPFSKEQNGKGRIPSLLPVRSIQG